MNSVLIEVCRGGAVESVHRGALAVVSAGGEHVLALGDVSRPVLPRSAVKLLQALPLVESGAAAALGLGDEELALACSSHSGEPAHVATAAAMLARAGVGAEVLECGAHWPLDEAAGRELAARGEAPGALHNNCSGKHAGFVCLAHHLAGGRELPAYARGYVEAGHPVMREVTAALEAATGRELSTAVLGIDGCSIPTFAIPLEHLALAFARVATGTGLRDGQAEAARRLLSAAARAPFMTAGSGRFDTRVLDLLGERAYCKVGAEGMYCAAFPESGLGVALKIDDGATRAAEVVLAALIEAFVPLDEREAQVVRGLADVPLRNWNGREVGALRPAAGFREAAAALSREGALGAPPCEGRGR